MPIEPAKLVRMVLPFLVNRFFRDSPKAVLRFMEGIFLSAPDGVFRESASSARISESVSGMESEVLFPSSMRMILVEYFSASSGLCVTMITRRSLEISFRISITCTLVAVSSAPVGSSASTMSGLLTIALAMATRCICPPLISLGRFRS